MAGLIAVARTLEGIALAAAGDAAGERAHATAVLVVTQLAEQPGATVGEIAAATGVAQSQVSKLIGELTAQGAITSERDPCDGRRNVLNLTEDFRRRLGGFGRHSVDPVFDASLAELSPSERRQARAAIETLVSLLAKPAPARPGKRVTDDGQTRR